MHYELPSHILETIISPTGSYKAVTAHHQKAMAVEILKRRKIMAELERKLGELVIDKADLFSDIVATSIAPPISSHASLSGKLRPFCCKS